MRRGVGPSFVHAFVRTVCPAALPGCTAAAVQPPAVRSVSRAKHTATAGPTVAAADAAAAAAALRGYIHEAQLL